MASFNGPKLTNPIGTDVPDTQEVLVALAKQDPTSISDIPSGAKRLYEASSGKWQWQLYNGTSWAPVPFLQHNVDQLDGYHAAITPAANTVAVRNASGLLEDNIAGNAATASSAATLSQTLPVNKGGTGATTSEAARANLGVPPTSHASTATTYGVGNSTQYGHLKLSDAVDSLSGVSGGIAATPAAVKIANDAANTAQQAADAAMTKANTVATASKAGIAYFPVPFTVGSDGKIGIRTASISQTGIIQLSSSVDSTSETTAATSKAVKTAYDKAVTAFNATDIVGEYKIAHTTSISGYLLCNGAAVSRTTYAGLFAKIGTTFGAGNGSTTFNLPDFRNKTFWGADGNLGTELEAGLPEISGRVPVLTYRKTPTVTGPFGNHKLAQYSVEGNGNSPTYGMELDFSAKRGNSIYGKSATVQTPAIAVNIFIKY